MSTVPSNKSGVGNTATWLSLQLFEINPIKDPTILPKPQDNTTLVEARWSSQEATKYIGPPFHLSHLLSRRCWWRHISSYGIQSHIVLGPRLGFLTLQVRIYNRGVSNCCWSSRLANFGIYCNWRSLQRLNFLYSIKTCSPMHFPIETIYIFMALLISLPIACHPLHVIPWPQSFKPSNLAIDDTTPPWTRER